MNISEWTLQQIEAGYQKQKNSFVCNYCGQNFVDEGENPEKQIKEHIQEIHQGNGYQLIHADTKYNTLTEVQKKLLEAFLQGKKDKEIAEEMGITPSTVRHQKFTFREKYKQAKFYMAMYQQVFASKSSSENLLAVPDKMNKVDERFFITEEEYDIAIRKYFDFSQGKVVLKQLPRGQKKVITVLNRIIEEFEKDRHYTAKETDEILSSIYLDYVLLRRYLVDYGFLSRTVDGRSYWRET
ncbi:hypothetical protein D920_02372 [Enterococcus faecalis 13-SD-W-01]|nr:hypothetical protein D920_02372 [Enterococcus faecalis 13-SD-W-01]